jgi:hypothetical protein
MSNGRLRPERVPVACCLAAFLGLAGAGCGGGLGDISGKVTFQNKTVVTGTVTVIGSDSLPYYGPIDKDGFYTVEKVPVGEAKVGVTSMDPRGVGLRPGAPKRPVEKGKSDIDPKLWFPIPPRYGDFNNSGLTLTVKRGPNTYNIELK